MIRYVSTRGSAPSLSFEDAVLAGLASDGGLYVPDDVPQFLPAQIASLAKLPYHELAVKIMTPFVGEFDKGALARICQESYHEFGHPDVAPLKQLNHNEWLLELFHGPTLAFKDFALQFLGRVMDHILRQRDEHIVIVGATSGDTGSAAIAGCRGRDNMDIVILHPAGRVSEVQRRQMTTVADENVHNFAVRGTFDDCQDLVKEMFADEAFRSKMKLGAVNSINWARVLAQVVYYFYAALSLGAPDRAVTFSVPTGNFGDIYAGWIAKRMGLPIKQLIIATNRNDILARCVSHGEYRMEKVVPTLSPSMDIQISSNFERLLFDLYERNGHAIGELMQRFRADKILSLSPSALHQLRQHFASASIDDAATKAMIAEIYHTTGEIIDPHTAVGVAAGRRIHTDQDTPLITLATAHPAKFPDAVKAACGIHPPLPEHMKDLFAYEEHFTEMPSDLTTIQQSIEKLCL